MFSDFGNADIVLLVVAIIGVIIAAFSPTIFGTRSKE